MFRGKDTRPSSFFLSIPAFVSPESRFVLPLGGTHGWVMTSRVSCHTSTPTSVGEGYEAPGPQVPETKLR